jgi:hypothetical protein
MDIIEKHQNFITQKKTTSFLYTENLSLFFNPQRKIRKGFYQALSIDLSHLFL